jgi:hypothetical protein
MANASTTQASSASETTGTPVPLCYGYVWATGKRHAYYQIQNTGNHHMDYHRVGLWLLGHGEWDGPAELWLNDDLTWRGNVAASAPDGSGFSGQNWLKALDGGPNFAFNWHSGCDSIIGSGMSPSSSGPDQGVDVLFAQFPPAINPLHFSRFVYYTILRKQPIQNQTNTHQDDPSQWTDINPIGLWRALKCRLFDATGTMTGYAFTTNPAWHFVDVILRRKLFPDYALDPTNGPDDLTPSVAKRFNWPSIWNAAQYFDEILSNGRRRFEGNYAFSSQTSLQAILEQIMQVSRSFTGEYAGQIYLNCDQPRSSVFTFSRDHILPGSFEASDQSVHTGGNRYISTFRDVLVPAAAQISSIVITGGRPVVTTTEPHPFNTGDWLAIGGTDTVYDGEWQVYSVPAVTGIGTPAEVDPTTFTLVAKGDNYPANVGARGSVGLLYSRFKERSPEFWHKANMLARGAVGNGIARQRNKVKVPLDFATSTYDQVSRITRYERDRTLGVDTTGTNGKLDAPYVSPPFLKLRTSLFAKDKFGNLAAAVRVGDHVTVDDTLSFTYAGEYEVLDGHKIFPPTTQVDTQGGSLQRAAMENSAEIEFPLGPYNEAIMYDTSDPTQAGWPSVPGSDPGNNSSYTQIDLANGIFVFFSGIQPSGSQFQLPSSGFPPANMLAWASPAGSNVNYHSAHIIRLCDASATRQLSLIYDDCEGTTWGGDVGFAAVAWLSNDVPVTAGGMTWIELTLLGGEKIAFGQGILADGATVTAPAGFTLDTDFCVAMMHDQASNGNTMFLAGAYVDAGGVVHFNVSDDSGHTWHGNANVLVFAYQNNMGTFTKTAVGGAKWAECTLSNGKQFGVGVQKSMNNGDTFSLPVAAGDGSSLQAIAGSSLGQYESGSSHAQGVGACYLDAENIIHITFNNGSGTTWNGQADVFAVYCAPGSASPTLVTVAPASATIAAGATQQFSASVQNNANQNVTWSVDGVAGGNVTVGTVDASGLYAAPNTPGQHTITATSVADPTASGSATVSVFGSNPMGNILTEDDGTIIYLDDGETIDVD